MPARRRPVLNTVLLVGEGTTEQAFLKHLKSLYIRRGSGVAVTIKNARGKGPAHVVDYAVRQRRNTAYDRVVALLDTDIPMPVATQKRACAEKIQIVGATPCIEGLLLNILGRHVPATSAGCKRCCGESLPVSLTTAEDYVDAFPKELLDREKATIVNLQMLLDSFSFT